MKKTNKKLDVVFLLDRSGSMSNCVEDTIGGYNAYLEKQRKNNNTLITTVLFDDHYELLHNRVEISKVNDITKEETFVLTKVDHSEDTTLISNSDIHIRTIMEYYRNGHLFFDNQQIKEKVVGLILPYFRY